MADYQRLSYVAYLVYDSWCINQSATSCPISFQSTQCTSRSTQDIRSSAKVISRKWWRRPSGWVMTPRCDNGNIRIPGWRRTAFDCSTLGSAARLLRIGPCGFDKLHPRQTDRQTGRETNKTINAVYKYVQPNSIHAIRGNYSRKRPSSPHCERILQDGVQARHQPAWRAPAATDDTPLFVPDWEKPSPPSSLHDEEGI